MATIETARQKAEKIYKSIDDKAAALKVMEIYEKHTAGLVPDEVARDAELLLSIPDRLRLGEFLKLDLSGCC